MTLGNKPRPRGKQGKQKERKTRCPHRWTETMITVPGIEDPLKLTKPIFGLKLEYNIKSSILSLRVQNQCQQLFILREILINDGSNTRVELFKDVLRMVPGYDFQYEKEYIFVLNQSYNVVLLCQHPNNDYQLREIASVQFYVPRTPRGPPLTLARLDPFDIPGHVQEVCSNRFSPNKNCSQNASEWLDRFLDYRKQGLNTLNYLEHLKMLNQIDECSAYLEHLSYTVQNAYLQPTDDSKRYQLSIKQFRVPPVLLDVGNHVRAICEPRGDYFHFFCSRITRGVVVERKTDNMLIAMEAPLCIRAKVTLEFPLNRIQFLIEYKALVCMSRMDFSTVAFPSLANQTVKKRGLLVSKQHKKFRWFQSKINGNALQQVAIRNIVNRTAYPAPYVLFGPPGTGKTCTIVEAVLQIYKLQPRSRILVTATSNYACNELTKRLLEFVPVTDIYRYMSAASERDINQMNLEVLEISNMYMGMFETPSMEDFVETRILVCTIINSARLLQLGVNTSMYDYIFIDECGSAKELSALVPIGSVGTAEKKNSLQASVIVAGDPKQLGPVTHLAYLKGTAHNVSLLERLMELPFYKKGPSNEYNTQVVTKLVDNYRSHNSLFKFSNDEFYDGELRAKASAETTEWAIGWKDLPNSKFPMLFHSVFGTMTQDPFTLSYLNSDEAEVVYRYVQDLLKHGIHGKLIFQQDIGIVAPYSRQVEYIKTGLANLGLENIEVGSAEQYQGREKPVIIITTVRSERKTVGFLADQRRLNVVMTRAMALTIIVGNPIDLKQDPTWYKLLKYLQSNKAVTGRKCNLGRSPSPAPEASKSMFTIHGDLF